MASAIPRDNEIIRGMLLDGVRQLMMGKEKYEQTLQDLKAKNNEDTPKAKNPACQDELTKTHNAYKETIQTSIDNLNAQYTIGQELKNLFERQIDIQVLGPSLADIKLRFNPLLLEHMKNASQIRTLESTIIILIEKPV